MEVLPIARPDQQQSDPAADLTARLATHDAGMQYGTGCAWNGASSIRLLPWKRPSRCLRTHSRTACESVAQEAEAQRRGRGRHQASPRRNGCPCGPPCPLAFSVLK
jgi:hypothetical protein